ncbi:protease propeptide/inhibitor [Panaeolus papilionaceus]|nr:protease propeptide/inhibitor [Panaeolus papilionaceus]
MSGKYIVVFKDHATQEQIDDYVKQVTHNSGEVTHHYDTVLKGFAAEIPDNIINSFEASEIIEYVEPDGIMTTQK